jgi:hypothetical protein
MARTYVRTPAGRFGNITNGATKLRADGVHGVVEFVEEYAVFDEPAWLVWTIDRTYPQGESNSRLQNESLPC